MFREYPYLNLQDLNLDYILRKIKEMQTELTNFVATNAIKYANPILWDITSQYEKNTVVVDPQTGTAYLSVAPVPIGVSLNNTDYWTVIFDLQLFVTKANKNFTDSVETTVTTTATFNTAQGDWLVWNDTLYRALINIVAGTAYIEGANIEHFTIEDVYNDYLTTIGNILSTIGDLDDLTTTDKTSVVYAINFINGVVGDLGNLITTDTSSVVNAINSIKSEIQPYEDSKPVNVLTLGVDNTGAVDCSDIINTALVTDSLYFPMGVYLITKPIQAYHNIYGAGNTHGSSVPDNLFPDRTLIKCDASFTGAAAIVIDGNNSVMLKDFDIEISGNEHGIDITPSSSVLFNNIDSVSILFVKTIGINVAPANATSKPVYINNSCIWGAAFAQSTGIYFSPNASDCIVTRTWIMGIQRGIHADHVILILDNIHIWNGTYTGYDVGDWWGSTVGIEYESAYITASNIYIDSPLVAFKGDGYGTVCVNNFIEWFDTSMTGSSRYDATLHYNDDYARLTIDNGYIRVTDRLQYIYYGSLVSNNLGIICNTGTDIQTSTKPLLFPELKENTTMNLNTLGSDTYQEVAAVYMPFTGSCEINIASAQAANTVTLKIRRDGGGVAVEQINELNTVNIYYTFSNDILTIYRYTLTNEDICVTNIHSTQSLHVINYNLIKMEDHTVYPRKHQANNTGLTLVTDKSEDTRKWVKVAETTANVSWSTQLGTLYAAWSSLTETEKRHAVIYSANGDTVEAIYTLAGKSVASFWLSSLSSDGKLTTMALRLINSTARQIQIATDGTVTNTDMSANVNALKLILYIDM